jgi:hypothetical protein
MAEEKMLWRNAKRQGSIAEYLFATEAMRQGFGLLMPLGDYLPYDCILDFEGNLFRVQVKSTAHRDGSCYHFKTCSGHNAKTLYDQRSFDAYAFNIYGTEHFYFFGIHEIATVSYRVHLHHDIDRLNNWDFFRE